MISLSIDQTISLIIAIFCSALISFTTTPLVRIFAYKLGAIDVPKDARRMHKVAMPLLGGLAIFLGYTITTIVFCDMSKIIAGMLLGSIIIVITGIVDDKVSINPFVKLAFQILSALVAYTSGIRIERINFFGKYIQFGSFSVIITVFWIVALTNAVNLIDGLDGLSCGISTISAISMLFSSFFLPDATFTVILLTGILAGSCAGFLPFNFNPAKIFMGDTGAMFLGYMLSVISIQGFFKVSAIVSFWVPFMVFALPLSDTFLAFFRRIIHGKSPFSADRGHIHHKLIDMGFNQKQSVTMLYAVSAIMGIAAILFAMGRLFGGITVFVAGIAIFIVNWHLVTKNIETRVKMGYIKSFNEDDED